MGPRQGEVTAMPRERRMEVRRCPEGSNLIHVQPWGLEPSAAMPQFTWDQLQEQLTRLRPERGALAAQLVATLRRRSALRPPEELLREMLCTVWTVLETES
jgi:hypothetical protein